MGKHSAPSVDNSAYERQLAEQKAATLKAEKEAQALKDAQADADERRRQGRSSLLASGPLGDDDTTAVKRKSLLGE